MRKKLLTGIFTILAAMSLSVSVFALTEGDWEFQLLDNEVTITGYLGEGGDVVIPSTIFGATVTKLDFGSTENTLYAATSITFPSTLKEISSAITHNYSSSSETLTKIVIPEGVEVIGEYTFYDCRNLSDVQLPSTIKEIQSRAFSNTAIKSINLPDNLEKLGERAFSNSALTEVYIPAISDAGWEVFAQCKNLKKVVFAEGNTIVPWSMFWECTALTDVIIPNTVTSLGVSGYHSGPFQGCTALKQIILPTSLKVIAPSSFSGCTSLIEVVVPYGVEEIGSSAFSHCSSLKSLYIPDTVTKLQGDFMLNSDNCIVYCNSDSETAKVCKEWSISYLTDKSVNSGITVLYNGTRVSFHTYDQNPELINNRTLVPLRAIFEAMNAEVEWDQSTLTATSTRNGVTVSIKIGDNQMYKNGTSIPVDVPAQVVNDRTMIPVRVIAEAFGADVQWNGNGRTVLINE